MNIWMMLMLTNVTLCYAGTGIIQMFNRNFAWGGMWLAYAVANGCLMWMSK